MWTAELILWVKPDCGACDRAKELVASLSAAMQFDCEVRRIVDADSELVPLVPFVTDAEGHILAQAPLEARELVDAILAHTANT